VVVPKMPTAHRRINNLSLWLWNLRALAQGDAVPLGKLGQIPDPAGVKLGIRRVRDRLLLDGGVHAHALQALALHHAFALGDLDGLGEQ
ncbi:hypothetical protein, partial [Arhodomonas sp. SL1]|uniref:hypothetical protein n=1 Tax=Arhodomonas sp. SL1 TaxID=3425691 RepID=UPI003F883105